MASDLKSVSFRLPSDLVARLDQYAASTQVTRTQALRTMLDATLSELRKREAEPPAPQTYRDITDEDSLMLFDTESNGLQVLIGRMSVLEFVRSNQSLDCLTPRDIDRYSSRIMELRGDRNAH